MSDPYPSNSDVPTAPLSNGRISKIDPFSIDYIDEDHIAALAKALSAPDQLPAEGDISPSSPRSPPVNSETWNYGEENGSLGVGGGGQGHGRKSAIEKLSATSDFAPIHQRVSRRKATSHQGLTYHLIRWPLLAFIFLIISIEFGAYVLTRQVVNVFEFVVAWRGHKEVLRQALRRARTYDEWVTAAKKLDEYLGFDEWKEVEEDSQFDYTLVKRVKRTLTRLRAAKDTRGLMDALAICVRSNFAGTESVKMYSETFYGTKKVVEAHLNEVATCLEFVRTSTDVTLEEKRAFFRAINKNYGSSALCLSGGASFGYYHFGVIKAFLEADLLPRIITGTSAGGIVAALLCTRTDDELKELLVPELAQRITACSEPITVWAKRFVKTGARFSTLEWARKAMFFCHGSLTFKEAYERTGRALNVSVVPSDRHSPTILLNHLTAPNCIIWSAIIASAAVPGILNPVVLMAKDRNGNINPHNLGGSRFKDGSLREDIPLGSLHTQFNCNFSIVSQTNPHIHLFFFAPRGSVGRPVAHRKGKGWRGGFILSALESYIKLDLTKHFKVIRDLDLLPQLLQSDWSGVFLQRFSGDLTLTPRSTISDWFRILSDPNEKQLGRMMDVGQRVTWPALRMVRNRMIIERAILRGRTEVRTALHRDRPTTDQNPQRPLNGLNPPHIPIESDADAAIALRSRRAKINRPSHQPPITDIFDRDPSRDKVFNPQASSTRRRKAPGTLTPTPRQFQGSPPSRNQPESSRGYASTMRETFRHVRSASISAALTSPFRRSMSGDNTVDGGSGGGAKRKSQMSIAKWFGGASSGSSSEEDGDEAEDIGGSAGEDMPVFSLQKLEGGESAVVDDDLEEISSEEEDFPRAVGSSEQGHGLGLLTASREVQYSPPQQDG